MYWNNYFMLTGKLAEQPTMVITKKGAHMCKFKISVTRWDAKDQKNTADQFELTAFGDNAGKAARIKPGDLVTVVGTLTLKEYSSIDGPKKYMDMNIREIHAERIYTDPNEYRRRTPVQQYGYDRDIIQDEPEEERQTERKGIRHVLSNIFD